MSDDYIILKKFCEENNFELDGFGCYTYDGYDKITENHINITISNTSNIFNIIITTDSFDKETDMITMKFDKHTQKTITETIKILKILLRKIKLKEINEL